MANPTRSKEKNINAAIRAPFRKQIPGVSGNGLTANSTNASVIPEAFAYDNGFSMRYRNNADTDDVRSMTVDSSDRVIVGEELSKMVRKTITFTLDTNASLGTQQFFIADRSYRIVGASYIHRVAGNDAAAVTCYLEHLTGTTAPASGTSLMTGTFNCKATANTQQTVSIAAGTMNAPTTGDSDDPNLMLSTGDRIGIVFAGVLTTLAGVQVTLTLAPGGVNHLVTFAMNANADIPAAEYIFTANRPYILTGAFYVHAVKGTDASAVTMQITKDTTTNAPGAGTALLTNNTNVGFDCKGTINTVQTGTLTATAASLRLATGDRLSFSITGTKTALAGMVVVLVLQSLSSDRVERVFNLDHIPGAADLVGWVATAYWTADRDYEIVDVREVHKTATGAAAKVTVTADSGTTAPGGGTVLVTDNTNAGFDLNATAATVQVGTLPVLGSRFLLTGDRLSVKPSGNLTSGVGVQVTVALSPR